MVGRAAWTRARGLRTVWAESSAAFPALPMESIRWSGKVTRFSARSPEMSLSHKLSHHLLYIGMKVSEN